MDNSKKIFFLILLLIVVIISCVYLHTESIYEENGNQPLKMVDKNVQPLKIEDRTVIGDTTPPSVKDSIELEKEPVVQIINTQNLDTNENNTSIEKKEEKVLAVVEEKPKEEVRKAEVKEKPVVEEVVEIKEELTFPLFTTDKRYKRTNGDIAIQNMSQETQLLQKELNAILEKAPINFKKGSSKLLKESMGTIEQISEFLKKHKNIKVEIAGHTTSVGKASNNEQVSIFRAANVKKVLIKMGINSKRMKGRGYGEKIPLFEDGKLPENRRIEVNIIGEK